MPSDREGAEVTMSSGLQPEDRCVVDLVRLALACECAKKAMRREDIVQQIPSLGRKGLLSDAIVLANAQLQKVFGMQIVALPASLESRLLLPAASNSAKRKQAVAQAAKTLSTANTAPTAYALVSSLSEEEAKLIAVRDSVAAELALLQVVLVTVALSGGVLDYHDLRNALMDVNLYTATLHDPEIGALDTLLAKFSRQRYLIKARNPSDTSSHVFTWGPRAFVEFPTDSLTELIHTMATQTGQAEPNIRKHIANALGSAAR